MTSDSIHADDPDDLPTLEEIGQVCEYLIEPIHERQGAGGSTTYRWHLKEFGGRIYDRGQTLTYNSAQFFIRQAFQRLRTQETAIIPIPERRERSQQ